MNRVVHVAEGGAKVLSWADDLDEKTIEQAKRTASLPFVEQPLALMADAHLGMGATIGSVLATNGAIIPSAVGVDIGCGMAALHLDLSSSDLPDDLSRIHSAIATVIPAGIPTKGNKGAGSHAAGPQRGNLDEVDALDELLTRAPQAALDDVQRVCRQFGTLGSGNHFVELCLDENDGVWLVLHSGSRGTGNKLAQAHIEQAKGLMKRYFIDVPDPDLAYLVEGTPEFDAYVYAMSWAQDYAAANREAMLHAALAAINGHMGRSTTVVELVNCHHNYAARERHRGKDVWVTRKGAIRARVGDRAIIPGSMATGSFIVEGLGEPTSYTSASHGAGRRMSRTQARKNLTAESLDIAMNGIAWNQDPKALLDEHPDAYKDIGAVMEAQADLVSVVHRLTTILNYKGA